MLYSIWVIPPEPTYSQLKKTVEDLSSTYSGPVFEPHMTLLGDIAKDLAEVEKKTKELASHAAQLELSLGPVSFSTTYFQSVFVRVNSTAQLMQLNLGAKKLFGRENDVFMPHISLLYGDHDMQTREKAAGQIHLPTATFVVREFVIVRAGPDPKDWKHEATISFGQTQR